MTDARASICLAGSSLVLVLPHFFSCPCLRSSPSTESLEQATIYQLLVADLEMGRECEG